MPPGGFGERSTLPAYPGQVGGGPSGNLRPPGNFGFRRRPGRGGGGGQQSGGGEGSGPEWAKPGQGGGGGKVRYPGLVSQYDWLTGPDDPYYTGASTEDKLHDWGDHWANRIGGALTGSAGAVGGVAGIAADIITNGAASRAIDQLAGDLLGDYGGYVIAGIGLIGGR